MYVIPIARRKSSGTNQISHSSPLVYRITVVHSLFYSTAGPRAHLVLYPRYTIGPLFDQVAPPAYPYSVWLFVRLTIPSRFILFGPLSSWSYVFCYFVVDPFRTRCLFYCMTLLLRTPVADRLV